MNKEDFIKIVEEHIRGRAVNINVVLQLYLFGRLKNKEFVELILKFALEGNKHGTASDLAIDLLAAFWSRNNITPILIPDHAISPICNEDADYIIAGALFRSNRSWSEVEQTIHRLDKKAVKEAKDNYWSDGTADWKWKEF